VGYYYLIEANNTGGIKVMSKLELIKNLKGNQAKVYREILKSNESIVMAANISKLSDLSKVQVSSAARALVKKGLIARRGHYLDLAMYSLID
jgi:predicted transcriptional regulator